MPEQRTMRRDARANVEKLHAAALATFTERGLGAPLEDIARAAGVSIGTLYNRVGSREALIDAVIPTIAGEKLLALKASVDAQPTPRARLERFVHGMVDLQLEDPALNDAMLRRFPEAAALISTCDRSMDLGHRLVAEAHDDGSLSDGFTSDDLLAIIWLAGTASRDAGAPGGWRRVIDRSLAAAWREPA